MKSSALVCSFLLKIEFNRIWQSVEKQAVPIERKKAENNYLGYLNIKLLIILYIIIK